MANFLRRVTASICTLACLFSIVGASAKGNSSVTEWFKEYDEIRRSAESTKSEKFQAMSFGKNEPNKENTELATRMLEKYSAAANAMKQLQPTPETKELQEGYTQYFSAGRQLFADFLEAQKVVPFRKTALLADKKKMQNVDKINKRIDAKLRRQFKIPKHEHI